VWAVCDVVRGVFPPVQVFPSVFLWGVWGSVLWGWLRGRINWCHTLEEGALVGLPQC